MATTTLSIRSNRFRNRAYLLGAVSSVALDAAIQENFILPTSPVFGQLLIESLIVSVGTFSGAYVAPAPAYDGFEVVVQDGTNRIDIVGASRFVHTSTISARPVLTAWFDLQNPTLMRQSDILQVQGAILAGAGVTGAISLGVRGIRFDTA